jgi:hypothetical protein
MLAAFPLLVIVVGLYHAVVLTGLGSLGAVLYDVTLISGATFAFTMGDLLMVLGLLLLYFEIFKATRTSSLSIVDHLLSMLLFIVCLIEFIILPGFGTSVFLMLTLMTFIDVVAGFTVTISTARRDIGVEEGLRR